MFALCIVLYMLNVLNMIKPLLVFLRPLLTVVFTGGSEQPGHTQQSMGHKQCLRGSSENMPRVAKVWAGTKCDCEHTLRPESGPQGWSPGWRCRWVLRSGGRTWLHLAALGRPEVGVFSGCVKYRHVMILFCEVIPGFLAWRLHKKDCA